ncbi:MAG: HlyC/CorC family transporter [Planctomycetes bacterium]|nr:HlyC/CorC family transporter [Planctomycetota bacterium]MCB9935242.1 HlyC/CorC family transporter [Planctomycetota bacterium]
MDFGNVIIFLGILFLSAVFSGTETAITAVSNVTVARLAEQGNRAAKLLQKLLRDKGRVIAALLVGNNVVNVVLAVFATVVFDGILKSNGLLPVWAAPIVASVASVVFLLVFGEVLPKSIAVHFRNKWALGSVWFVLGLMLVTKPVTWLLIQFSNGIMRLMGQRPGEEDIFDVHEIHTVAHLGEQMGVIDTMEKQLIQRAAHLNDTRVREIMIPRTDIQGIEVHAGIEEIRQLFQKTPYSRIPVYQGDLDDIVGILNFKEFLRHEPAAGRAFDVMAFLHKPLFVSESMFIGDLLNEMRSRRTHLAIALDEYGGTSGLLTLEDVVEMLVGRIEDEYDIVSTPFQQLDGNTWEVDGRVSDERLVRQLGLKLPPEALEGFDTAAGLALKAFGNIPSEGDVTTYHGLEIAATRVRGHRVRRLQVRIMPPDEIEALAEQPEPAPSTRRRNTRQILADEIEADRKSLDQSPAASQAGSEEGKQE